MKEKVQAVLDEIRPMLQADGGDVELVDVKENVVFVKLVGACGGCPMASITLKNGIEMKIKEELPEITEVVDVNAQQDLGGGCHA